MVLALAGGRRPSLIAGSGGLPRSGRWRGFVGFASVLPSVHLPALCATSRQREGMGLVCWSDWDVESFVPKCETSRGFCTTPRRKRRFARGMAQDLATESVLTGYMRCRGTRGISAILEKWPIPLSGANPPVSGVYHTTVKNVFFVLVWQRLRRHGCTRTASSAQPHPHNRHRPAGERRPDALPMRPQEVLDESHQGESHE